MSAFWMVYAYGMIALVVALVGNMLFQRFRPREQRERLIREQFQLTEGENARIRYPDVPDARVREIARQEGFHFMGYSAPYDRTLNFQRDA